jgi:MYXO-CTERM domain-containing protein
MNRIAAGIAVIGLGLATSGARADDYNAVVDVDFDWATNGIAKGWTSSATNSLSTVADTTAFITLPGSNTEGYYNSDFAQAGGAGWCPAGQEAFQAQYACRTLAQASPITGVGPGAKATGSLTVTSTTLTGTLTVVNTNDEGAGPQPGTSAATGYNIRTADGSPFVNVWYGISNQMTLTVNLTGTFSETAWQVTGGTVRFADPAFQCAFADFAGVLCNPSSSAGGFQPNGSFLGWGMPNIAGAGTIEPIPVFDVTGATQISTISGVRTFSSTVNPDGTLTVLGEVRNGAGLGACPTSIRYNTGTSSISCGSLTVRDLEITVKPPAVEAPDEFVFDPVVDAALATEFTSNPVTIAGLTQPAAISVTGGAYSIGCTASFTTDNGTIENDQTVCVRQTSSSTPGVTTNTVLTVGGGSGTFSVTTIPPDTTPDLFGFLPATDQPLNTPVVSDPATITGINVATAISVSAGGEYNINGGPFTSTAGTVVDGDVVRVRVTSSPLGLTGTSATLTVGTESATFNVFTLEADTSPDPFSFGAVLDAPLGTVITSNTVTISGINVATPISITGGEYSINGAGFTSAGGTVVDGDQVTVRQTSAAAPETTTNAILQVGDQAAPFSVTTGDTTPIQFTFTDVTGAPLGTATTSNAITVFGITLPSPITITGGEYSINSGVFTSAPGTVTNGQQVVVRQTSSPNFSTTTNTVLTIGGVSDTFSVTTLAADTTPDPFSFTPQVDVAFNAPIISNPVTITGINAATPISILQIAGPVSAVAYSIDGAAFTSAAGTVTNGQQVRVRVTSAGTPSTATTAQLNVGGVVANFTVTTVAVVPDTQPDPFFFQDANNAPLNTVVESNVVTISGINVASNITVTGPAGSNPQYRINGGTWTNAAGTISAGDTLQLRHTTSGTAGRAISTTVTIGNPPPPFPPGPNTTSRSAEFSSLTTPPGDGGSSSMDFLALGLLGGLAFLRRRRPTMG